MIMIHPKTLVKREVADSHTLKIEILGRAGFIPLEKYRPPKKPKPPKPVPTLAEKVKGEADKVEKDPDATPEIVEAVHEPTKKAAPKRKPAQKAKSK